MSEVSIIYYQNNTVGRHSLPLRHFFDEPKTTLFGSFFNGSSIVALLNLKAEEEGRVSFGIVIISELVSGIFEGEVVIAFVVTEVKA